MARQKKLVALRPFVFRGEMLEANDEFEPDTEEQASLLITIGHAALHKRSPYRNRSITQAEHAAVMTTEV